MDESIGKPIKILLVGDRYTGKGQIGRLWGRTEADLPTLQPVILYDRIFDLEGIPRRVVAWVLSFDPEFADLRSCFYKNSDGMIVTIRLDAKKRESLTSLDGYLEEVKREIGCLPPQILVGTRVDSEDKVTDNYAQNIRRWNTSHGDLPYFEVDTTDPQQGTQTVEMVFQGLLSNIRTHDG